MEVLTVKEVERQLTNILEIFTGKIYPDVSDSDWINVQVNTNLFLTYEKLRKLLELCTLELKRSGAGITITMRLLK